jgi:hypothetical protein
MTAKHLQRIVSEAIDSVIDIEPSTPMSPRSRKRDQTTSVAIRELEERTRRGKSFRKLGSRVTTEPLPRLRQAGQLHGVVGWADGLVRAHRRGLHPPELWRTILASAE